MSRDHALWRSPRMLGAIASILGLAAVLLYLSGAIGGHKVQPGTTTVPPAVLAGTEHAVTVREVVDVVEWPGTVRSRVVANVAPRVLARVAAVHVHMGAAVKAGDPLVTLDAAELAAKREQARAAFAQAEAEAQHALQDERRVRALFEQNAATQQDLDAVIARSRAATAARQRARDALAEAEVAVNETILRAPFDGVVAARLADPGDLAVPGQPLLVVHDPATLRFEAAIGESSTAALAVGATLAVRLDHPPEEFLGRVEEIAPQAEPATRTVRVKLSLPARPGIRPGAYGVVRVPSGQHRATLVPRSALHRRGQLEFLYVRTDDGVVLRQVRTGKPYGEEIEILSGVAEGERILVPRNARG